MLASPDAPYITGQSIVLDGASGSPSPTPHHEGTPVHLYLDTADQAAAESLLTTGLFAGLTTNPTILQRASQGVGDIPHIHRWAGADGCERSATRWSSSSSPHAPVRRPVPRSPPRGSRPC